MGSHGLKRGQHLKLGKYIKSKLFLQGLDNFVKFKGFWIFHGEVFENVHKLRKSNNYLYNPWNPLLWTFSTPTAHFKLLY